MSTPPQPSSPATVPALILGEGITLLGVLRGLAEAGIPSWTACEAGDYVRLSRWHRSLPGEALCWETPADLVASLARVPLERAVLVPCSDSSAVAVASLPEPLQARFAASCSSAEVQAVLANKLHFARVLQRLEIPHPETHEVGSAETIEDMPEAELVRFFLKPQDSETFVRRYGTKGWLLEGKEDALRKYGRLGDEDKGLVLQEFIPGGPERHFFIDGFIDRHGRVRARFARQRIRVHPFPLGNSTCLVSVPMTEVDSAWSSLDLLLTDLDFRGIFSAEFKRDTRDGVYKLLEVNARPWWFIGFAQSCGLNMAAMAYHDALGHEVPEVLGYPTGRWCVHDLPDLRASLRELRTGKLSGRPWATAWIRGSRPILAWDDPGPTALENLRQIPRVIRRLLLGRGNSNTRRRR